MIKVSSVFKIKCRFSFNDAMGSEYGEYISDWHRTSNCPWRFHSFYKNTLKNCDLLFTDEGDEYVLSSCLKMFFLNLVVFMIPNYWHNTKYFVRSLREVKGKCHSKWCTSFLYNITIICLSRISHIACFSFTIWSLVFPNFFSQEACKSKPVCEFSLQVFFLLNLSISPYKMSIALSKIGFDVHLWRPQFLILFLHLKLFTEIRNFILEVSIYLIFLLCGGQI